MLELTHFFLKFIKLFVRISKSRHWAVRFLREITETTKQENLVFS